MTRGRRTVSAGLGAFIRLRDIAAANAPGHQRGRERRPAPHPEAAALLAVGPQHRRKSSGSIDSRMRPSIHVCAIGCSPPWNGGIVLITEAPGA